MPGDGTAERGRVEVRLACARDVEGAALEGHEPLVDELLAAVDDLGLLGAVLEGALRDVRDVHLVDLAEIGGEGVRDPALLADPGDGDGRVEAAREGDADALADGQRLKDVAHAGSVVGRRRRTRSVTGLSLLRRDLAHGRLELGGAEGALEPGPDHTRAIDDERERLALELPLVRPSGSCPWPGRCPRRSRCG